MNPVVINTGPIDVLEKALKEARQTNNWFELIVFSAIQLERFGYLEIKDYLQSLKVNSKLVEKILYRINLRKVARYLLALDMITTKEYKTIVKINEERNKYVHRKEGYLFLIGTRATREYEPLAKEAIRILKEKLNAIRGVAM